MAEGGGGGVSPSLSLDPIFLCIVEEEGDDDDDDDDDGKLKFLVEDWIRKEGVCGCCGSKVKELTEDRRRSPPRANLVMGDIIVSDG